MERNWDQLGNGRRAMVDMFYLKAGEGAID